MNDALGMRHVHRIRHLNRERNQQRHVKAVAGEVVLERLAAHELHHEIRAAFGFADVIDGANVRVAQRGSGTRLPLEPVPRRLIHEGFFGQNLDRHITIQARVARLIDLPHASCANRRKNFIRPQHRTCSQQHIKPFQKVYQMPFLNTARMTRDWGR